MIMGLNLGAGRATFPTKPDNPYTAHLMYAIETSCPEALDDAVQWTNVDRINGPNINEVINLWRLPWLKADGRPYPDNTFDVVWLSHIVEHIPHDMRINPNAHTLDAYLTKLAQSDGDMWWGWFYEVWRILKPGGRMCIIAPHAFSYGGVGDPTHTRYLTPNTFSYFTPNPDAPFDYDLPYQFKQVRGMYKLCGKSMQMAGQLDALKQSDGRAGMLIDMVALEAQLEEQTSTHVQQVEEMFFAFEAVKP